MGRQAGERLKDWKAEVKMKMETEVGKAFSESLGRAKEAAQNFNQVSFHSCRTLPSLFREEQSEP
eukprot:2875466-Rhodomonas_salina.2